MATNDFRPPPPGAQNPPGPPIEADRTGPGGTIGAPNSSSGSYGVSGSYGAVGPGSAPFPSVAPGTDPVEPDYRADQWQAIHWTASSEESDESKQQLLAAEEHEPWRIWARTSLAEYTPLHVAVKFNRTWAATQLVRLFKADINHPDVLGQTPLHLACRYPVDRRILAWMLVSHAKVDFRDKYSWTPLFWAAYNGFTDSCNFLLGCGASYNITDKYGRKPADVAKNPRDAESWPTAYHPPRQ